MNIHWKDWWRSWNSSTLATWCKELTHWQRCWDGLGARGEGDKRGWDGWMASLTPWAWVWVNSGSLWWKGRPGVLRLMGLQRVGHDWVTELNWTEHYIKCQAGWSTSWDQDFWEKYQLPRICRWYQSNGRKQREMKEPLDEGERRKLNSWLKTQHSK